MKVSLNGLVEIAGHEGVVPAPYLDSRNIWTWGVGHTAAAGSPDPVRMVKGMPANIDAAIVQVLGQFNIDLEKYEQRVNDAINVELQQYQFDALVSFDLNTGGIYKATLTKRINANDPNAGDSFLGWLRPPEIRSRRTDEMNLFKTGSYSSRPVSVWKVSTNGKLYGIYKTLQAAELTKLLRR